MANCGALFRKSDGVFLGSCFVFRYSNTLLTAAHCVREIKASDLVVQLIITPQKSHQVTSVEKHPRADVAVLKVTGVDEREIGWQPYAVFDDAGYGNEVMSCGCPEDIVMGKSVPVPRVFRGYIQRIVHWNSHLGYSYMAVELSFRCPSGLSGGKLFNPEFNGRIYGVVTENIRTSNILDSFEEVQEDGKTTFRETHESVIYYGMAVWLPAIIDWLDAKIPPITPEEQQRRGAIQNELLRLDAAQSSNA